jgi:hypothetical protein
MPSSPPQYFAVGDAILRDIDGMAFPARILAVQPNDKYRIEYLDDGNMEDMVPSYEMSKAPEDMSLPLTAPERKQRVAQGTEISAALLFNVDKEAEEAKHLEVPKVTLHGTEEDDEHYYSDDDDGGGGGGEGKDERRGKGGKRTGGSGSGAAMYVIGGDQAVPRGGGLKALRALRK